MDIVNLHLYELDWIYAIQQLRTPFSDLFFSLLNVLDTQAMAFIFIIVIAIGYRSRDGYRLVAIIFLSFWLNTICKESLALPRPFHLDPSLELMFVRGYGFPSGAAQSAVLFPLILISRFPFLWAYFTASQLFIWLSFSRVYLGLHFPSDILGGWIIGFFLWIVYHLGFPFFENLIQKWSWKKKILALSLLFFSLVQVNSSPHMIILFSFFISFSFSFCLALEKKWLFEPASKRKEIVLRSFMGLLGAGVIHHILYNIVPNPVFGAMAAAIGVGAWIGCLAFLTWRFICGFFKGGFS